MNQGAMALKARIDELGIGQNEAARRVEADSGNFSRIVNGTALPGRKVAANILREFGVTSELFDAAPNADGKGAA
jgi:plasmid maintenance system antidote protein VapI